MKTPPPPFRMDTRSGNMLIYILGAIFLMGLLIVLLKGSFQEGSGTDGEKLVLKVTQVQKYASELERGVNYVLANGFSETEIRFATNISSTYGDITHDERRQIFKPKGGGVEYKTPPAGINDGTAWQFFGTTHFRDFGTDTPASSQKAELIAVLPKVTEAFCSQLNRTVGQTINLASISDPALNGCIYEPGSEFQGTFVAGAGANVLDNAVVTKTPAKEACVKCDNGTFNYYRVLMGR